MAESDILGLYSAAIIESLAEDGERIARECELNRTYTHRTHNLKDSYGWGVYYKSRLVKSGFLTSTSSAQEPRRLSGVDVYGRKEIEARLQSYKPTSEYELIVYAAMPYTSVLETHGYRVISVAHKLLKDSIIATKVNVNIANIT